MATAPVVGTLSTQGWVTEPLHSVDFLLSHFFEVQESQYRYLLNVKSFQKIVDDNMGNFGQMAQLLKETLMQYLLTSFSNIQMDVVVLPINGDPHSSNWNLEIRCSYDDYKGEKHSLGRAVLMYGKNFQRLAVLNETGELK